jgi:hypothetical protein
MNVNVENIEKGEKFATVNALIRATGNEPKKDNSKKAQVKEIERYVSFEKTGKINRGKETNEIIITKIYSEPKDKIDLRTEKTGIYTDDISTLLAIVPDGIYTTTQLYKVMFGNTFDSYYIEPWKHTHATKNQNAIMLNLRNRFKNNLIATMDKINFRYVKRYKLWNGKEWGEGIVTTLQSECIPDSITNDKIENAELEVSNKLCKKYEVEKLNYLQKQELHEQTEKKIKKVYGYQHYCIVYEIRNINDASRYQVSKARKNLRKMLADATIKYCGRHFYYMKNSNKKKTRIPNYPFCNDDISIKLLNDIAGNENYIQNNPKIFKIGRTTYFGRKAKGS